jgi:cytochrome c oxidase subunit IV
MAAITHGHATAAEHKHPNYMAIFWALAALTVLELAVVFMPFGKFTAGTLLCGLALGKAALVAMYFMHLRFEVRTLAMIAVIPLVIATLLVFVLLPDGFAVAHKSQIRKGAETSEGAPAEKH